MEWPSPVSGNGLMATWLNKLLAAAKAHAPVQTPGIRLQRTTGGTFIETEPGGGGKGKASGINYRGDFQDNISYAVGDVVRSRSGNYALGLFICVFSNPVIPATGKCVGPSYPEPFDVNGAQNYWELWTLGVKLYTSCKSGVSKQTYINLNET